MIKLIYKLLLIMTVLIAFSAKAQILTFETNPALLGAEITTASAATTQTSLEIAKKIFTASLELLKKRLLDMTVDQTVNWIQGGGEPLFITDWRAYFNDVANIAGGDLIQELGAGFLCRPFGVQLQLAVQQPPRFTRVITCTLDQVVNNVLNFYEDFRSGGFIAYRELWQPQNNFYGAVMMALEEKENRVASALYASAQEALAGNGILGTRKCYPKPGFPVQEGISFEAQAKRNPYGFYCFITTPGSQVGALVAKAIGSDIDYIINSEDLAAYVAAISDALINRLVREGVGGLRGLAVDNLPSSRGYIADNQPDNQPCAGLRGETLRSCQNFVGSSTNNFGENQKNYIDQINLTLAPLQSAENNLQQSINLQRTLINKLTELKLCQTNRGVSGKEATVAELETEQKKIDQMTADLGSLQNASVPLLNAKLHIENLPSGNVYDLNAAFNEIRKLLNPIKANEAESIAKKELSDTQTRVAPRTLQVQQSINTCGSS
ncbi:MAG: hypothetical protein AAB890_00930 [Patescibacteria group bacterium]